MTNTRKFFHDRLVLFLLTINSFITAATVVVLTVRIAGGGQGSFIQSYRSNLGLDSTSVGGAGELVAFIVFAVMVFVVHIFMALEFYKFRITSAWVVMLLTTLLLVLNFIVANSLLDLR